jgi:choline dehydrogenase
VLTLKSSPAVQSHDLHIFPTSIFETDPKSSLSGAEFTLFVSILKPFSRGRLQLHSSDPATAPLIDLAYFTQPGDMPRMIEAVRVARCLAKTPPLSEWVVQELYPGPQVPDADSDLEASVLAQVETYHHPVGTCRMGSATDAMSVVNMRGDVHGVEGLSVVDASIMPVIPAANTNLPTIMVAERCAAWVTETD